MKRFLCLLLASGLLLLPGCAEMEDLGKEIVDQAAGASMENEEHVLAVKNAVPEEYPNCTYGKAFDEYFSDSTWKYFESDDGRDIVEFTGHCMYDGAEVKVLLQFIVNMEAGSFEVGALSFNEIRQDQLTTAVLIDTVFENYRSASASSETPTEDQAPAPDVGSSNSDLERVAASDMFNYYADYDSFYSMMTEACLTPYYKDNGDPALAFTYTGDYTDISDVIYYVDITDATYDLDNVLNILGELHAYESSESLGTIAIYYDPDDYVTVYVPDDTIDVYGIAGEYYSPGSYE